MDYYTYFNSFLDKSDAFFANRLDFCLENASNYIASDDISMKVPFVYLFEYMEKHLLVLIS